MAIRVGISGWTYPPWRGGTFYPKDLAHKRELEYASRQVGTIEINGSFYSLQRPGSYRAWHDATPEGFIFSVKGSRFITHMRRLRDVEVPLANFFASGVLELREKLGPFLWQLPPSFRYDRERLEGFFTLLPRNASAAARLARKHDERVAGKDLSARGHQAARLRHAIEVRHESFATEEFVTLLRKHDIGLVVADTAGKWPFMEDITSGFIYVRLHGDQQLYASGYGDAALRTWATKIRAWSKGRRPVKARTLAPHQAEDAAHDVFVYFDNDVKVHAPFDAMSLAGKLRVGPPKSRASSPHP